MKKSEQMPRNLSLNSARLNFPTSKGTKPMVSIKNFLPSEADPKAIEKLASPEKPTETIQRTKVI